MADFIVIIIQPLLIHCGLFGTAVRSCGGVVVYWVFGLCDSRLEVLHLGSGARKIVLFFALYL
jgi:hypothetical protein